MDRVIWRPPRLRTLETDERSATWTELFYDLVFVVAVARLGARFLHDVSWVGLWEFAFLFTVLWWGWVSFTFFADRYDTDDAGQRLLAVAQMIGVAGMAAAIGLGDQYLDTISRQFAASFTAVRLALIVMYARAWRSVPETQTLVGGYLKGFSIEVVVWFISIFTPPPARYGLWILGLAIGLATPYLMRKVQVHVPLSVSHLPERFGLFTILVLGEGIAAVVVGVENEAWDATATMAGIAGVIMVTSLWWVYFDNLEGSVVRRDPTKKHDWHPTAWLYSHLPLAVTLTMAGIGVEEVVVAAAGHEFDAAHRWLAAGGVAGAYAAMAMILISSTPPDSRLHYRRKAWMRLGGAAAVIVLGLVGGDFRPVLFAILLALIAAAQVGADVIDYWYSIRAELPAAQEPAGPAASPDDAHAI